MDLNQFLELKKKVEMAKQKMDRAKGSLDQLRNQLQEKFGTRNTKKARELLESLKEKKKELDMSVEEALAVVEEATDGKL